jgi:MurE/MurF fusion protein
MKLSESYQNLPENIQSLEIVGISADSRKIKTNYAFVAIAGSNSNGHDYINSAIDNGAICIITETKIDIPVSVPVWVVADARKTLVDILAILYPNRPEKLYAVTGTNGKTSVADFIRQIAVMDCNRKAISIGTLGLIASNVPQEIMDNMPYAVNHTTPDPEILYPVLDYCGKNGITDCVIEASSHGLSQHRLAGLKFDCVLFTNFSRDHLDYHKTEADYFDAKMRLFTHHTHKDTVAIIFHNDDKSDDVIKIAKKEKCKIIKVGVDTKKSDFNITKFMPHITGADFTLVLNKKETIDLKTSLVGKFQTQNLVMSLLAVKSIRDITITQDILGKIQSVDGRLDYIESFNNAAVYVDYAHTPDALEKALLALRPHCTGKLICVFGCGGNRDTGKRPLMGQVANDSADIAIITDDNPRFEDANTIREQILAGIIDKKSEIITLPDRRDAIIKALSIAMPNDIILVAGKGHENGQIICDKILPFKDAQVIRHEINNLNLRHIGLSTNENIMTDNAQKTDKKILWTQTGICALTGGTVIKPFEITGIAIDSREVRKGDLFIALKARRDGHYFIKNATQYGAVAALVAWKPRNLPKGFPIVYVKNTLGALEALAVGGRNRMRGKIIAVTGTAGKTTVKEIMGKILTQQGITHASDKSFNNHIGVPLSLARMSVDTQYGIFEIGMNKAGEISNLVKMVRPDVAIITTVGDGHREFFNSVQDIARAKAEITEGVKAGGIVILNRDIETFDILRETAESRNLNIVTFGQSENTNARLISCEFSEATGKSDLTIDLDGQEICISVALHGVHNALNICAILLALKAVNADIPQALITLGELTPASGRGEVLNLEIPNKGMVTIIDESYNANPLSMHAALTNMIPIKPTDTGKKIIVLGAMRELGDITEQAHIDLKDDIIAGGYDTIYLVGNEMMPLYDALGDNQPTVLSEELTDIFDEIVTETTAGSVVMIKGSNSVQLWKLVTHFKQIGNFYATQTNGDNPDTADMAMDNPSDCDDAFDKNDDAMDESEDFKKVV